MDADLTASLTPAERDAGRVVMPMTEVTAMPGGATVLVRTNRYVKASGVMVPGDLLVVDVSDGRVARRLGNRRRRARLDGAWCGAARPRDRHEKAVMTVSGYVFSVILRGALDQV